MNGLALRRAVVVALLAAGAVALAAIVFGGSDDYVLHAKFRQAGGLREGFTVRIDGAPVGKIESLSLDADDHVVAKLRIDEGAAPVGRGVRATARAADLLGEKFVDLEPGNRSDAAPSGTVVPASRTGLAVELDDVINAVDLPTRQALKVFINEQGSAYVGRGQDLAALLAALPPSLDRTRELLSQFAGDGRALGRLVEESDRVVASVARERDSLGRLVSSAGDTLATLGRRSRELGATVQRAPGALASARRALSALEGAATALAPAARGLRTTTPALISTLRELPAFTAAARPTLRTLRDATPALERLGHEATPVVRRLQPLASELATFADAADPLTETLDTGAADLLGVLEGWARATQGHDEASHIFRFGLTVNPAAFADLVPLMGATERRRGQTRKRTRGPRTADAKPPKPPAATSPQRIDVEPLPDDATDTLGPLTGEGDGAQQLLDYLLGP